MKLLLFCLLAGVFPGWSETQGATFAPIALYTQFQQAPPEGVLEALQDEVESIMVPIGLRFEWRELVHRDSRMLQASRPRPAIEGTVGTP